nr:penicillin-binding protein 1C [Massilia sp. TS11]
MGAAGVAALLLAVRLWPHAPLRGAQPQSTAVYARDGSLLRLALASDGQYRLWVPLDQIDPRLAQAVQLYEDRWFFWHPGVNPVALARAAFATASGGARQGASTLSMQLARRLYRIPSQSVGGKLRQIGAALWLEARYSKRAILEAYLNLAPYGGNIEGVGAASLVYFHKRPSQLTLTESLSLAVMPQNPRKRGGLRTPGSSSPEVLAARARLWQRWLERHPDAARYRHEVLAPSPMFTRAQLPSGAAHFSERVLREAAPGEVWSTLDPRLQATLERSLAQYLERGRAQGIRNAALLLLDREQGEVRALVGSADHDDASIDGQVNGVEAKRSPGSTLKPFIYGLALDQGLIHPLSVLKDAPTAFGPFSPENFDGRFVGPISAQEALVRSRNVPAVGLASRLTRPSLYQFLQQAGVSRLASEQHYGLALALGGGELTMEELGRLYLMLGHGGQSLSLRYVRGPAPAPGARWLSPEAAFITLQMLKTNPRPDTGEPAAPAVAWKTGTSWGFRDAWTAGVFGPYVLLVWIGNFDGSGNPAFVGIQTAAPLFFQIVDSLRAQHLDPGEGERAVPAGVSRVEVCAASGELPNAWCRERAETWFIPGTSPITVSQLHRPVRIDTRSGKPTCADGPFVRTEVYEFWPSDLQRLFREAGMPRREAPPLPDCAATAGEGEGPHITAPNTGQVYTERLAKPVPLALRASAANSSAPLFWFANGGLLGKASAGSSLSWLPPRPGRYQLRVIDDQGRSDVREIEVEFAR